MRVHANNMQEININDVQTCHDWTRNEASSISDSERQVSTQFDKKNVESGELQVVGAQQLMPIRPTFIQLPLIYLNYYIYYLTIP